MPGSGSPRPLAGSAVERLLDGALGECLLARPADRVHLTVAGPAVAGVGQQAGMLEELGPFADQP